jgi:hypothetical protein
MPGHSPSKTGVNALSPRASMGRRGCMDCRIKHALGAAEGRAHVSGNDGRKWSAQMTRAGKPAGPCCSLQLKWYSLHGNGGAASAAVGAILELCSGTMGSRAERRRRPAQAIKLKLERRGRCFRRNGSRSRDGGKRTANRNKTPHTLGLYTHATTTRTFSKGAQSAPA